MSKENRIPGAGRLGDYILCSPALLQNAVRKQEQALKQGQESRLIGRILLEDGDITGEELENAIRRQRADRLARCPVFSTLNEIELSALSSRFVEISVPPGRQFIIQDEPDPVLYIIASGKVEVYRTNLDGGHVHIAYVEAPEPIGEMGYFSDGKRTASVKAVDEAQLLWADYSALTHYFENAPHAAHTFMTIVNERRKVTEQITRENK